MSVQGVGIIVRTHEKGFGFIEDVNDPNPAIWFHFHSLHDLWLTESVGRQVRYNAEPNDKGTGLRATAVWPEDFYYHPPGAPGSF
jgi:cold shock CspA family protein